MATTKVVISGAVTMAHPDGTKLTRKAVAAHLRAVLERECDEDYKGGLTVSKVVIRSVDMD